MSTLIFLGTIGLLFLGYSFCGKLLLSSLNIELVILGVFIIAEFAKKGAQQNN